MWVKMEESVEVVHILHSSALLILIRGDLTFIAYILLIFWMKCDSAHTVSFTVSCYLLTAIFIWFKAHHCMYISAPNRKLCGFQLSLVTKTSFSEPCVILSMEQQNSEHHRIFDRNELHKYLLTSQLFSTLGQNIAFHLAVSASDWLRLMITKSMFSMLPSNEGKT